MWGCRQSCSDPLIKELLWLFVGGSSEQFLIHQCQHPEVLAALCFRWNRIFGSIILVAVL